MGEPATPSQTIGPFFGFSLPFEAGPDAVAAADPRAVRVEGQVLDGDGEPVPDALIEIWAGDQFARCGTDSEGAYHLVVAKPLAQGAQAPHLNVIVFARGLLKHLLTRIYFPEETAANAADPVLTLAGERASTLIGRGGDGVLHFDVRLQGEGETVFLAPPGS